MERQLRRVLAACTAALFLPLIYPLATWRVMTRDDLAAWHLPFRHLYQQALVAGDSFLWTSAFRSGLYIHGEGEVGMAHPLHWLMYRWLPLTAAFNLELIGTYVAILGGTGLLLVELGLAFEAAWFGALVFTFSGFNLFNLAHMNHIATLAHLPWALYAAHVLMTSASNRRRAWAFAGFATIVGSQFLVGNPQYIWITAVALGCMTVYVLALGAPLTRVALLLLSGVFGVAIGAIQLLPTLEYASASVRNGWQLSERLSFSLNPLNLAQLWSPFAFRFRVVAPEAEAQIVHEFIVYNGAFCTLSLAWLMIRWKAMRHRRLALALLGFAGLALVLALGRYGLVYPLLAQLPGVRNFRAPARHIVLFQFAMSGIAAVVFEDVLTVVRERRPATWPTWPLAASAMLTIGITGSAAILSRTPWATSPSMPFSGPLRSAPFALVALAAAALFAAGAKGARWALPALVVLTAIDLGAWGYSYTYRWGPLDSVAGLASRAVIPPGVGAGDLIAPMPAGSTVNLPVLRGLRLTDGYVGVPSASRLDPDDPVTERIAGAVARPVGTGWMRIQDTMPRVRLVTEARVSRNVPADVKTIDLGTVALVDEAIDGMDGPVGSARAVNDRPGAITVQTDAPRRQLLVVAERFHSGWHVRLDGHERTVVRVYGDYIGCVVDAGRHDIAFTFMPDSVRDGLRASLAGVALTIVGTLALMSTAPVLPRARDGARISA